MNNIADGGYASFVTSYYETVLLKNDTQKTVAALFSATERKIYFGRIQCRKAHSSRIFALY